jgi:A/G-specific adenine glycosylase
LGEWEGSEGKREEFAQRLVSWFSANGRDFPWRRERDPFRVLVAEKLLQQTTYGHVLKAYGAFFEKFPDARALAAAEVSDIEAAIRGLGFQRQRARQLKELACSLVAEHGGAVPRDKGALLRLSGVGEYVASAVLCFAFGMDEPIVDINVRRVVGRLFGWRGLKDNEIAERLRQMIPPGRGREFNWALIDFSALVCSRRPKCRKCPLSDLCPSAEAGGAT